MRRVFMEWVCPICNGMASYVIKCSDCGHQMEARGALQDYFDDYSPYLDKSITQRMDGVEGHKCVHIFYCSNCNDDRRIPVNQMWM